jgi:hypothetical protein
VVLGLGAVGHADVQHGGRGAGGIAGVVPVPATTGSQSGCREQARQGQRDSASCSHRFLLCICWRMLTPEPREQVHRGVRTLSWEERTP